ARRCRDAPVRPRGRRPGPTAPTGGVDPRRATTPGAGSALRVVARDPLRPGRHAPLRGSDHADLPGPRRVAGPRRDRLARIARARVVTPPLTPSRMTQARIALALRRRLGDLAR